MVLRVEADGRPWLADVGFGALGLLEPIELAEGVTSAQAGLTYQLRREGHLWILSCEAPDVAAPNTRVVMDLYEFSEDPQTAGDVEVANHYTSTHPASIFRRSLTIQRTTRRERLILSDRTVTRYCGGAVDEQSFERAELAARARELFGVELPAGRLVFEQDPPFPP